MYHRKQEFNVQWNSRVEKLVTALEQNDRSTVKDFLLKHEKNPLKEHPTALDAIFEFSFKSLSEESSNLLGVVSFLMPDSISMDLFVAEDEAGEPNDLPEALDFCSDHDEFVSQTRWFFLANLVLDQVREGIGTSLHSGTC